MMINPFKGCSGTAMMEGSDLKPNAYSYQVRLSTSEQNPNRGVMMVSRTEERARYTRGD